MSESSTRDATLGELGFLRHISDLISPPDGREPYTPMTPFERAALNAISARRILLSASVPSETPRIDDQEINHLALKVIYSLPAPMLPSHREDSIRILEAALRDVCARSATRPICPFRNPAALYANPNNTRAEGPPASLQTRKKCPTCPYFNGCMVGDCDYGN